MRHVLALSLLVACAPPKSATYGGALAACVAAAEAQATVTKEQACQQSIQCEQAVRARHNRPPRVASLDCR